MKAFKVMGFVFAMVFGINFVAFSQNWFVGASANLRFSNDSTFTTDYDDGNIVEGQIERRTVKISPEVGYKFNKFDFGINPIIRYNFMNSKQDSNISAQDALSFGIGLFSRYNFITVFDRLSILGRMDINYLFSKTEREGDNGTITYQDEQIAHRIGLSISPVIEFKVSDRLSLYSSIIGSIASIGYAYTSINMKNNNEHVNNERNSDGHNFTFSLPAVYGFSLTDISLGFYVTF
jgi:hypothetical protein